MKILLVEDDAVLRGALEELLCREGYDVIKASNVSSTRSAINSEVDLIMLDVGLPDGQMGNSEVGHNALGAGQVFAQGAKLVSEAIESGRMFDVV